MPKAWIYFSSINGFEKKPQPKRESVYAFSIIFIIYLVTFEVNLYVGFLQNAIWFLSLDVYFVTQWLLYVEKKHWFLTNVSCLFLYAFDFSINGIIEMLIILLIVILVI